MKVNVTCMDCEITVEEIDGKCVVTALQNGEEVESFEVDCGSGSEELEQPEMDMEEQPEMDEEDMDMEEEEIVEESVKTFKDFFKK
jgi:hypothetical protein